MLQADALAPTLASQDYTDIGQLASVGDARQQLAQHGINSAVDRYNYDQNLPYQHAGQLHKMIQGNYGSSSTQTTQNSANTDRRRSGVGQKQLRSVQYGREPASPFVLAVNFRCSASHGCGNGDFGLIRERAGRSSTRFQLAVSVIGRAHLRGVKDG